MTSIWKKTVTLTPRPSLPGDLTAEAVVIGGGLAGVLTALYLKERGVDAVVLEAARLGSGQTGNTTAKLTSQHGMCYAKLIRQFGEKAAGQYARANQEALAEYRRLIAARGIDCDLEERPAYLYSTAAEDPLREEARAARSLGLDAEFTTETTLPFGVKGAVRLEGQAMFHPLKFLRAAAEQLTVYEETRVLEAEGELLTTNRGTVRAKHVIFACHYPFVNLPGYYFMRMHQERSYVLALEGTAALDGMYLGVDPDGLSFRNFDKYLLLGGGNHRTGENSAGGKYRLLEQAAETYYPKAGGAAKWSAQDCMPMDGVPYIGRFSASTPNWYVATGFGKWGMTTSMVSALLLSGLICGEAPDWAEVFSPQRFDLPASAKNLLEDGKQAVKGLTRELFAPPRGELEKLPLGHGGIVDCDGKKVGVYKDEQGETFLVDPRCPHLGCQVEWNPDEKSWDCPCHGSRFDFRGNLMDNPAQEDLKRD